jgi:CheY-like chemotaxis protein
MTLTDTCVIAVLSGCARILTLTRLHPATIRRLQRQDYVARYGAAMSDKISLVVDDEPSVRKFITAVLRSNGFQIIEAENGVQALELLRKLGTVDLLVSDIHMPKMDGIALACSVRAEHPAIPVILVSGYSDLLQANRLHAFELVPKPFLPVTLLRAVTKVMMRNRPAPSE